MTPFLEGIWKWTNERIFLWCLVGIGSVVKLKEKLLEDKCWPHCSLCENIFYTTGQPDW